MLPKFRFVFLPLHFPTACVSYFAPKIGQESNNSETLQVKMQSVYSVWAIVYLATV